MSVKCERDCVSNDHGICWRTKCWRAPDEAHNPALTSAGQVGSSGLLVAREGDQQLDTTGSQLGPLVARDELIDKPGRAHCKAGNRAIGPCEPNDCETCGYYY